MISVLLHNKKDDEDTEIRMKLDDRVDLTFFSHVNSEQARMDNRAIFPCVFFTFQAVSHCSDFNMKKKTRKKGNLKQAKMDFVDNPIYPISDPGPRALIIWGKRDDFL